MVGVSVADDVGATMLTYKVLLGPLETHTYRTFTVDVFWIFMPACEKHCSVNVTVLPAATGFVSNEREPSLPCAMNDVPAKS
jgi:hypothetical protein